MSITHLALFVTCGAGKSFECPDEVQGKLATRLIEIAGKTISLNLTARICFELDKGLCIELISRNLFDVNKMLNAIHTVAQDLFKWTPVTIEDARNKGFFTQPLLSQVWENPAIYMTRGDDNKADFYELFLKQYRRVKNVSDICSLQQNGDQIILIGNKNTVIEVMDLFRSKLCPRPGL